MATEHLTGGEQVALVLLAVGFVTCCYWLARLLIVAVLVVGYLLYVGLILTARLLVRVEDAHARGIERVRRYEAREPA